MQEIKTLIDKASKICGGDKALAERIGIQAPSLSQMRSNKRTVTPETAAELAAIAGEDPQKAAIQAMIDRAQGTRRGEVLKAILGKGMMAVTVAGVVTASALWPNDASASSLKTTFHDVYCDFLKTWKALLTRRRYIFR